MKHFKLIEPNIEQTFGLRFKWRAIIKTYETEDGLRHEFTTTTTGTGRFVGVIAITPGKEVVTTYQFRAGPERWMYDLPGGGLKAYEDVLQGALRELQEETGYIAGHIEHLGSVCRDAYSNDVIDFFLAMDCTLSETGRHLDEEESAQGAEVRLIPIARLIDNAKHDQMVDPVAVLMAYDKLKDLKEAN